jgi:NAD(P)H-hydrate epimerase
VFASVVEVINAASAQVVVIDMPSGLMCESNQENDEAHIVRADLTLTFQYPKLAQLLDDNYNYVGALRILDIGLSKDYAARLVSPYTLLSESQISPLRKPRSPIGHKGTFGHALLIAGKYGMAGAAILAAKACLRSGVGKVTVHTPQRNNDILQISVPEAILSHDADASCFTQPLDDLSGYQALGIGPGLGTSSSTALAVLEQVQLAGLPLVVDADALNILAAHHHALHLLPKGAILTPHLGEFKRLGNRSVNHFTALSEAREMAVTLGIYIILKGRHTAICTPEGKTFFNATGNSGMATAGSGDVLTGILTSLLAQGYDALHACLYGVWLHGLAGDLAAAELSPEALTATDIIEYLPKAILKMSNKS